MSPNNNMSPNNPTFRLEENVQAAITEPNAVKILNENFRSDCWDSCCCWISVNLSCRAGHRLHHDPLTIARNSRSICLTSSSASRVFDPCSVLPDFAGRPGRLLRRALRPFSPPAPLPRENAGSP